MKKKRIIISVFLVLILVSGICVAVLYNISNRVSDTIIDTLELPDDKSGTAKEEASFSPDGQANETNAKISPNVTGGQSEGNASLQQKKEKIKESVPMTDKMFITAEVLTRLSKSDIAALRGMLQGGLTESEKQRAEKIALSRFSADELKRIYQIYYKCAGLVSSS